MGGRSGPPSPTDRAKPGSKHHLLTDAQGLPLVAQVSAANVADVRRLLPLVDAVNWPAPRQGKPRRLLADAAYDSQRHRAELCARGLLPVIRRRGSGHGSGLGRERSVIERTFARLRQFRRLRLRYERRADLLHSLLTLACCVLCAHRLAR